MSAKKSTRWPSSCKYTNQQTVSAEAQLHQPFKASYLPEERDGILSNIVLFEEQQVVRDGKGCLRSVTGYITKETHVWILQILERTGQPEAALDTTSMERGRAAV